MANIKEIWKDITGFEGLYQIPKRYSSMITPHTQLLQHLIDRYKLTSYCEIGVQDCNNNFNKLKCVDKVGVDPSPINADYRIAIGTSDEFFETMDLPNFQLFFIDGLHHQDQVKRDFENCLKHLAPGGFIVLHDTCPETEKGTEVPRVEKRWWGDVYKFAMKLKQYHGIGYATLDIDEGITIVWKDSNMLGGEVDYEITWPIYLECRKVMLNIISPANLDTHLP